MAATETSISAACAWSLILSIAGLVLTVTLSASASSENRLEAGLFAGLLTSSSLIHESMTLAPMTEPLAMVAVLVTLCAALRANAHSNFLGASAIGVGILFASLVRYNLAPMLAVPLLLNHLWRAATKAPTRWTLLEPLIWLAPTVGVFLGWSLLRPDLFKAIAHFFGNVDSGIPLLSFENLAWLSDSFVGQVAGTPFAAILVVLLAFRLLHPTRIPGARLLGLVVMVGVVALLTHRYKLGRNLYVLVPVLYAWVASAWWARAGSGREWAAVAGVSVAAVVLMHSLSDGIAQESYFSGDRSIRHGLDAIATTSRGSERVVIAGAHRDFNEHVLSYWLRSEGITAEVLFEPSYAPGCVRENPRPGLVCEPQLIQTWMDAPGTTFVTISQSGPRAAAGASARREWTNMMWGQVEDLLKERAYDHQDIEVRTASLRVRVYRRLED